MNISTRGSSSVASAPAVVEAAERFGRDRAEIVDSLMGGRDPGRLAAIEATTGDPHQRGRRVLFLHFERRVDPLVYKPRSVTSAALFSRLVDWLNGRVPELGLVSVETLVRPGYGWAGFVRPAPCRTGGDAERFYFRQGALLALLYATNTTDVHADNLIAHGDQPILVDTETLLHPVLSPPTLVAADPALIALDTSVHRTVLLPTLRYDPEGTRDISGLGGASSENRPVLDGVALEPGGYVPELVRGFGEAFSAIGSDADGFIGVLEGGRRVVTRVLARATRTYAELIGNESAFESLAGAPTFAGSARLLEHECRDLGEGDIPIFFTRPESRSIWSSRGVRVDEAFEVSGLDAVRTKVRAMDDAQRRRQEWVIDAAFATGTGAISHRTADSVRIPARSPAPLDPRWAVDQASEIAERLEELACRDGHRVNWMSLEPLEDGHWRLLPAGGGLAHGYPGVALFLAQLGVLAGRDVYLERAAEAIGPLPSLLESLAGLPEHLRSIGCGFAGMGGIVYVLARLATLLDSGDLARCAARTIELVVRSAGADGSYLDGRAGAVAALGAVRRELGVERAAEAARELGDPGVGDGWCPGTAAQAAAGRVEGAALGAWLDRLAGLGPVSDLSLCHGELGILDALAILGPGDPRAREEFDRRRAALPWAVEHGARLAGTPRGVLAPGLLHGLAGTGYGLLRAGFPHAVPSALMMEPALRAR
ncbi:MAG TPA: type 2 lanthipeptide synthetase LanM family protein [Actinospica sp.]|nr:type 2 lanthipeptide synthetase LanM family protein [Actinospica sp.]